MSIRGRVVARDERPLAEARVGLSEAPVPMPDVAALTGADGSFVLATPAAGRYTVTAAMDGYRSSSVTVAVAGAQDDAPAEIILVPAG